jgi:hypothetical protein
MSEINNLMDYYLDNAAILKKGIEACGFTAYGGEDAPYVFVDLGAGKSSWDMFSHIMENAQVRIQLLKRTIFCYVFGNGQQRLATGDNG